MANSWTKDQLDAINLEGNNILVSAGAGSGKTAVLSERVLRKIKQGVSVDEMLILTFTNAAAKEMKERIRKILKKSGNIEQMNLVDNSYITTFDSFSLSIVKKYHTILNISKDIGITDASLLEIKKLELIDEIFDNLYKEKDPDFYELIHNFCLKDDKSLKRQILKLNDQLDMKYDKANYLSTYIDNYYNSDFYNKSILKYYEVIEKIIFKIKEVIKQLNLYLDFDYIIKLEDKLSKLFKANSYNEIVNSLDIRLPNLPKNQPEEVKKLKEKITVYLRDIKNLCMYECEEKIKEEIEATKRQVETIIKIIKEFDYKFTNYKYEHNMFDFLDISRMAIDIVSNHKEIQDELRNRFQEIMIDEYQDTNDLGEYFISLISNNNVYMVGDIKQSIYRFRNANPYIFKTKYDEYSKSNSGIKIDLLKNFRSREEVVKNINLLFQDMMSDELGGANYKLDHQMVYGNLAYKNEGKTDQYYDTEIYTYEIDPKYSKAEKEIFIIAEDILKKVKEKFQVFDKDQGILRDIKYQDFAILIDRSTDFDLYKKIFEYLQIPLTLYKDEELKSEEDLLIIKNLFRLIMLMDKEEEKQEFKYCFLSIGRSFLFRLSDEELFDYINNDTYKDSIIYKKLEQAYKYYYDLSPKMFFIKVLEIFNYEENLLKIGNVKLGRIRCEYIYQLLDEFSKTGKDLEDFLEYLNTIYDKDQKVTFSLNSKEVDSVQIMTIHKSKGLEYPICYLSGLTKEFSFKELNDNILYSNKYGIVTPYFNEYTKPTIFKNLLKIDTKNEELSEKIRLFYVAVTRAREKLIIVMPKIDDDNVELEKAKSFYDFMKVIRSNIESFQKDIEANYTKDYFLTTNNNKELKIKNSNQLSIKEYNFLYEEVTKDKFSKKKIELVTKEEFDKMEYGTKIHEVLEFLDFTNPDYDNISPEVVRIIRPFIESDLISKNLDATFYKEYEFIEEVDDQINHGIIDLMIENDREIILIDYKLKNTNDLAYNKQLEGYKKYIEAKTNKTVKAYLYSLIDQTFSKIDSEIISEIS